MAKLYEDANVCNERIFNGLIAEQEAWANKARTKRLLNEQLEIIAKAQEKMVEINNNHAKAPGLLVQLKDALHKFRKNEAMSKHQRDITRLLRMQQELNKLEAK